eukprot:CAMPEP_0201498654 /NCGR_PEP_ID=MMETSP0151_2-20130828/72278_1 /ASSEMBLY_ACC=CAM_ASM_000257 /TAXON_ID=200890 /ORGANISM="Paramoeba atlantica, Strain 621/1 / CCAP 1560/9" /LENGTH=108 /DNA_ID=CAMNT_0047890397 /DNA_START=191 /DNA_END=514 /DNA_ORIENTATION=-
MMHIDTPRPCDLIQQLIRTFCGYLLRDLSALCDDLCRTRRLLRRGLRDETNPETGGRGGRRRGLHRRLPPFSHIGDDIDIREKGEKPSFGARRHPVAHIRGDPQAVGN